MAVGDMAFGDMGFAARPSGLPSLRTFHRHTAYGNASACL